MEAQLNSITSATFLTSLQTQILKINFCKYGICFVYIVKSLSFFCCEAIFIIFPWKLIVISLPSTHLFFIGLLLWTGFTNPVFTWSDCNWTRTQNHLVLKRTINHLADWLSVRIRTKWFCVRIQLQSLSSLVYEFFLER